MGRLDVEHRTGKGTYLGRQVKEGRQWWIKRAPFDSFHAPTHAPTGRLTLEEERRVTFTSSDLKQSEAI